MPNTIGFLIGDILYHPGDSLFIKNKPWAKIVTIPISGAVTMDPKEAIQFVKEIKPELVIPMHYEPSPKFHPVNDTKLFNKLIRKTKLKYKILRDGQIIEIK